MWKKSRRNIDCLKAINEWSCLWCDQCVLHHAMVGCRVFYPPVPFQVQRPGWCCSLWLSLVLRQGFTAEQIPELPSQQRGALFCPGVGVVVVWGSWSWFLCTLPLIPWCFIGPQEPLTACKPKPGFVLVPVSTGRRQIWVQRHSGAPLALSAPAPLIPCHSAWGQSMLVMTEFQTYKRSIPKDSAQSSCFCDTLSL